MASFVIYPLNGGAQLCPLDTERTSTVGRHPKKNQWVLTNDSVSSHHATLTFRDGAWYVQDLGSTNGTRVNGGLIEKVALIDGDCVHFGDVPAVFFEDDTAASASAKGAIGSRPPPPSRVPPASPLKSKSRKVLSSLTILRAQLLTFGMLGFILWLIASAYPTVEQYFERRRLDVAERYKAASSARTLETTSKTEPSASTTPLPLPTKIDSAGTKTASAAAPTTLRPSASAAAPTTLGPSPGPSNTAAVIAPIAAPKKTAAPATVASTPAKIGGPVVKNVDPKLAKAANLTPMPNTTPSPEPGKPQISAAEPKAPLAGPEALVPAQAMTNVPESKDFMGPPAPAPAANMAATPSGQPMKAEVMLNPKTGQFELLMADGSVHPLLNTKNQTPAKLPAAPPPTPVSTYTGRPPPSQEPLTALLPSVSQDELQFASPEAMLKAVGKDRPRLIHSQEGWSRLQALVHSDSVGRELLTSLEASGRNLLKEPHLQRVFGTSQSQMLGDEALGRITTLGCLHYLAKSDPVWAKRGSAELLSLCDSSSFPDWGDGRSLPRLLIAGCLGYDWFAASMDEASRQKARTTLIEKGLMPLVAEIKKMDLVKLTDHRGMVAFAAVLIFSLTFHDELPAEVDALFANTLKKWAQGLFAFSPDGLWPEGVSAGEEVLFYSVPVLQTFVSHGAPSNLNLLDGLALAHQNRMMKIGPYGNTGADTFLASPRETLLGPVSTWLSGRYGNPGYPGLTASTKTSFKTAHLETASNLLYFNPWAAADGIPPQVMSKYWEKSCSMILRTDWKPEGLTVDFNGMATGSDPFLADMGAFTLSSNGVDWGVNLRRLASQSGVELRRSGYTAGSAAYNSLFLGVEFKTDDHSHFVKSTFTDSQSLAILEYKLKDHRQIRSWQRGVFLVKPAIGDDHKGMFVVQDEIHTRDAIEGVWQMHTRANVGIRGGNALLEQEGQSMLAVILAPKDARFSVEEAPQQLPPLPSLNGYRKLQIRMPELRGRNTFTVAFYPSLESPPKSLPTVTTSLEKWVPKK